MIDSIVLALAEVIFPISSYIEIFKIKDIEDILSRSALSYLT